MNRLSHRRRGGQNGRWRSRTRGQGRRRHGRGRGARRACGDAVRRRRRMRRRLRRSRSACRASRRCSSASAVHRLQAGLLQEVLALDVQIKDFTTGTDAMRAVQAGQIDARVGADADRAWRAIAKGTSLVGIEGMDMVDWQVGSIDPSISTCCRPEGSDDRRRHGRRRAVQRAVGDAQQVRADDQRRQDGQLPGRGRR